MCLLLPLRQPILLQPLLPTFSRVLGDGENRDDELKVDTRENRAQHEHDRRSDNVHEHAGRAGLAGSQIGVDGREARYQERN